MKSYLDVLIESLEEGTWVAASSLERFNSPIQRYKAHPVDNAADVALNRPVSEVEILARDPVAMAVRSLLKSDEYIDDDGRIRKIQ